MVTALIPHLGYAAASAIAKAALAGEGDVRVAGAAHRAVEQARLDDLLDPRRLAGLPMTRDGEH